MMKQQTLAMAADQDAGFEQFRKATRHDEFLNAIIPRADMASVIKTRYPNGAGSRLRIGLQPILRFHFTQHWFNLADLACKEALCDSTRLRCFVGIDLGATRLPIDKVQRAKNRNKSRIRARHLVCST